MSRRSRLSARPTLERLDSRLVLSAVTPSQLLAAYGLNAVTFSSNGKAVAGDGTGQTIAIVDAYHDPNAATELATFSSKYGLAAANLTVVNLGSAGNRNSGWAEEEALDIEAAHLAAPGAKIVLIEAKSSSVTDLLAAVDVANKTAGVTVVSMSWGSSEWAGETAYDRYFTQPGITYVAASGDSPGTQWPSSSPNVISVGGTSLVATTAGRTAETGWSSSGGGTSRFESEPSYQSVAQSTGQRTTPDVAGVADPNTGLSVYTVAGGGWVQIGGTSLATPIWAGLIAVADQGRVLAGKPTLTSTQALGDLYQAPAGSFNDIVSGGGAKVSYDTVTGLGTPNARTLIAALVADPAAGVSTTGNGVGGDPLPTTGGGTTTGGGGSTGGGSTNPPRYPWQRPGRGGGFFGRTGSSSGSPSGWAGANLPRNSGQGTSTYTPITPIRGIRQSTATAPRILRTTPGASEPTTPPAAESTTTASQRAVDAVIHRWGHARA